MKPLGELLPQAVIEALHQFLEDQRTGQIVLDAKEGKVLHYSLREDYRVRDMAEPHH